MQNVVTFNTSCDVSCLPDIQVATRHSRWFLEPPTFGGKQ